MAQNKVLEAKLDEIFGGQGVLSKNLTDFKIRKSQIELAKEVGSALETNGILVAEAGTGTGKSFAYLIPAMVSNKRCIISTAGKTLQDQLFRKDIPFLQKALNVYPDVVVLKGRSNYVCHEHLKNYAAYDTFEFADEGAKLAKITLFAAKSKTGDKNECKGISEDDPIWQKVTSRRETCLGSECPYINECFVKKARERALEADIVIVNHHLFLSSLALKKDGANVSFDGLLPTVDLTVIDEAHKLADIATSFFGEELSTNLIHNRIDEVLSEIKELGTEVNYQVWEGLHLQVIQEITDVFNRCTNSILKEDTKMDITDLINKDSLFDVIENLARALIFFTYSVKTLSSRSETLKLASEELIQICAHLLKWLWVIDEEKAKAEFLVRDKEFIRASLKAKEKYRKDALTKEDKENLKKIPQEEKELNFREGSNYTLPKFAFMVDVSRSEEDYPKSPWRDLAHIYTSIDTSKHLANNVYWIELTKKAVKLHVTPIDFSTQFRQIMDSEESAWVFTSATISVGGSFEHFMRELGIDKDRAKTGIWDSPFNFYEQALLWVPKELDPRGRVGELHSEAVVDEVWPLIDLVGGKTFILCTSLKAVELITAKIRGLIRANDKEYPVFSQGEAAKAHLIEEFRKSGNGILVGSMSFWEGVDVKGDALRLVVLDKLPFATPNDPVFKARCRKVEDAGGHPFSALSVPQAIIHLKQGCGRLIRSESDTGLLVICDTRLISKDYGKRIVKALPDFARTIRKERAIEFFADYESYKSKLYSS